MLSTDGERGVGVGPRRVALLLREEAVERTEGAGDPARAPPLLPVTRDCRRCGRSAAGSACVGGGSAGVGLEAGGGERAVFGGGERLEGLGNDGERGEAAQTWASSWSSGIGKEQLEHLTVGSSWESRAAGAAGARSCAISCGWVRGRVGWGWEGEERRRRG